MSRQPLTTTRAWFLQNRFWEVTFKGGKVYLREGSKETLHANPAFAKAILDARTVIELHDHASMRERVYVAGVVRHKKSDHLFTLARDEGGLYWYFNRNPEVESSMAHLDFTRIQRVE